MQDDAAALLDGDREASAAARTAMEKTLAGPSAAHPTEGYGSDNLSLAKVSSFLKIFEDYAIMLLWAA